MNVEKLQPVSHIKQLFLSENTHRIGILLNAIIPARSAMNLYSCVDVV